MKWPRPGLWAVLAAASAVLGWFVLPSAPERQNLVTARRDAWNLPPLPRREVEAVSIIAVAAAPFWGTAIKVAPDPAAAAPPEDRRWRIAAIFGGASQRGVLIVFNAEGKPPLRLFAGDRLPSGDRIVSIGDRELCVRLSNNKTYRMGVERLDP